MAEKFIYMDHNATTPLHEEVKRSIRDAMNVFGNPSSMHEYGRKARSLIENARRTVASFIGADEKELIFVGSGSEANNTVLNLISCSSSFCTVHPTEHTEIVTTSIEHPCILETSKCLNERGIDVQYVDVDKEGKVNIKQLKNMLSDKTALVSVIMANNEIGTIQDIKEISRIVRKTKAYFHTDAVQAVGKIPVNVEDLGVDFLSFSAHKLYGPKGVGALYVKKGVPFCPFIRGGHQEQGMRAGTENTLGIVGMAAAIEMCKREMKDEEKRLLSLKHQLKNDIKKNIADVQFNGHADDCLANTLNVSFSGVEGESILLYLDLEGIAVSTGSACSSGSLDPSHVLLATGTTPELAHGSIRFSLGRDNTIEEVEYVVKKLTGIIQKLREMSTVYKH